jgi:Fe(3+) dicitrate transport protein
MIDFKFAFKFKYFLNFIFILTLVKFNWVYADDRTAVEKLSVFGKKENLPTRPGSAHVISEEELKKFNDTDINQVLRSVPGVNLQEEDGFGLRPNIGLRGGNPHRSKKVVLMEDGVLIGPAPYAAPAAYYFPQLDKISSVEVYKGVPSTQFGPNSIGGAINLITRMNEPGVRLAATTGSFGLQKYDLGVGIETFGDISLTVNRLESTGFKKLQNKDNTGFVRNNVTLRWDKYFVPYDQNINLKFNWSDEVSNETYGGIAQTDFNQDPYQRYTATELDQMKWSHRQYYLSYALNPIKDLRLRLVTYRHGFDRSWNKLNNFGDLVNPSVDISDVMKHPDFAANQYFYQVLKGQADSGALSNNRDVLELGNNQRRFISQGAQLNLDYELDAFNLLHQFQVTYRLHEDQINRHHESQFYNMISGSLNLNTDLAKKTTTLNLGKAQAQTLAFNYETTWEDLTVNAITRIEDINYEQLDRVTSSDIRSKDNFVAPGLGFYYQAFENIGFLAGVNKAFTPVGPGQANSIKPEEAINYEFGVRSNGTVGFEVIGFYSDYKNLLGTCTFSGGCNESQLDQSFNGGKAQVLGTEFLLKTEFKTHEINFPVMLTATYTKAQFKNSFASALEEWGTGQINSGDPLPYIPEWQTNLSLGMQWKKLSTYLRLNYLGSMPDQSVSVDRDTIKSRVVAGLATHYKFSHQFGVNLRIDNLMDQKYAVSQRPFGLRPGQPRAFMVGAQYDF